MKHIREIVKNVVLVSFIIFSTTKICGMILYVSCKFKQKLLFYCRVQYIELCMPHILY
jgi:hypothetical protein